MQSERDDEPWKKDPAYWSAVAEFQRRHGRLP